METTPKKWHVFRQPRNADEFEQLLRLRFEVFSEKGEAVFSDPTNMALGLDLNAYDACSIHFGLFEKEAGGGERPVGALRFIDAVPQPEAVGWVREVLLRHKDLSWKVLEVPAEPLLQSLTRGSALEAPTAGLFKKYRSNCVKFFEISRLSLTKEARHQLNAQKCVDAGLSLLVRLGCNALFGPDAAHRPMYQPYFNYPLQLAGSFHFGLTEKTIVFASPDCLHPAKKPRIERMAAALLRTGEIAWREDWPDFMPPELVGQKAAQPKNLPKSV